MESCYGHRSWNAYNVHYWMAEAHWWHDKKNKLVSILIRDLIEKSIARQQPLNNIRNNPPWESISRCAIREIVEEIYENPLEYFPKKTTPEGGVFNRLSLESGIKERVNYLAKEYCYLHPQDGTYEDLYAVDDDEVDDDNEG